MSLFSPSLLSTHHDDLTVGEFRELRATIRERGTARAFVILLTFVSWGSLVFAAHTAPHPLVAALVPLVVLLAGFEVAFALHVGAERVGRYLFVFYEMAGERAGWETTIANFGRTDAATATRVQALVHVPFLAATVVNVLVPGWGYLAAAPGALTSPTAMAVMVAHLACAARILQALRQARGQRAKDTAAFLELAKRTPS